MRYEDDYGFLRNRDKVRDRKVVKANKKNKKEKEKDNKIEKKGEMERVLFVKM